MESEIMLSREEYIQLSLELNLFFGRILKEHSFFLEAGFTCKDSHLAQEAESFKNQYELFLAEAISLANGVISPASIRSGEFVTPYTQNAERISQFYTGIALNTNLTQAESALAAGMGMMHLPVLEQRVFMLNQKAIILTTALVQFKTRILSDVIACKLFTVNYPLLIDHIMREAKLYIRMLTRLQNRERLDTVNDLMEQEIFWNRIMAEHSKFIRGLLDPTEDDLINKANNFGNEFDELTRKAITATEQTSLISGVTNESINAVTQIKDFKTAGTKGMIDCKIKSIMVPLLGDHVLREANHFLRILLRA
jgi:hypothetical protein